MIKALIVDDEELARRGLQLRLEPVTDFSVCGEAHNGRQAVDAVRKLRPDVMFLDIQMPGMDGFEVIRALAGQPMPCIVFVTAFDQFAIEAFDANAIDYLLKPLDQQRFDASLQRVRESLAERAAQDQQSALLRLISTLGGEELTLEQALAAAAIPDDRYSTTLQIRHRDRTENVPVTNINHIEAAGDYLCLDTSDTTHILRGTLKALLERLDPAVFVRIHRSVVVNRQAVRGVRTHRNGEYFVKLKSDREFRSGRTFRNQVRSLTPNTR